MMQLHQSWVKDNKVVYTAVREVFEVAADSVHEPWTQDWIKLDFRVLTNHILEQNIPKHVSVTLAAHV